MLAISAHPLPDGRGSDQVGLSAKASQVSSKRKLLQVQQRKAAEAAWESGWLEVVALARRLVVRRRKEKRRPIAIRDLLG
jgi:hypothetical protein